MLTSLRRLLTTVRRLIVTAHRHLAGALCVLLLAGFICGGFALAVLYAALELVRMALALAGG
ncbi:hypothetical protein [Burkholderia gladioli]|uniref:hypothetical protein n=1 Tax=Burkholderia gladioli TaxID=28095 RepID=UPI00164190B2|nr:hypothetical protein [Burkholderia gladioli]